MKFIAHKVSYYIDPRIAPSLEEIDRLLHQGDQTVNATMSFGQYLDILPIRASATTPTSKRWPPP